MCEKTRGMMVVVVAVGPTMHSGVEYSTRQTHRIVPKFQSAFLESPHYTSMTVSPKAEQMLSVPNRQVKTRGPQRRAMQLRWKYSNERPSKSTYVTCVSCFPFALPFLPRELRTSLLQRACGKPSTGRTRCAQSQCNSCAHTRDAWPGCPVRNALPYVWPCCCCRCSCVRLRALKRNQLLSSAPLPSRLLDLHLSIIPQLRPSRCRSSSRR